MKKAAVIGAGTMGLDIARVFAESGFEVIVRDISDQIVSAAKERLQAGLARQISKGRITEADRNRILSQMTFTTEMGMAADADIVVEAAIENLEIKQGIFRELDALCKPETILATNTSSISITALAAATGRPDRFIGMHFFNPATVMKLAEVIRGAKTSDETCEAVLALARQLGKEPVTVHEAPGFVVNRLLIPMINEAADLVYTGVATAEDIDTAMKLGANHPMGPLSLGDLIGLDVVVYIMDVLFNETHDSRYRCSLLLRQMVRAGRLGRKTGEGFFRY